MGNLEAEVRRILGPIVEGQIRSFLHDHPEVLTGVQRHVHFRKSATDWVKDSLAKRITNDLASGSTTARLRTAVLELAPGRPEEAEAEAQTASAGARGGMEAAPGDPSQITTTTFRSTR